MREKSKVLNSESNGSLMRITPLGVYLSKLDSVDELVKLVKAEVSLTHQVPVAKEASVSYCIMLRYLINHLGDREGAYQEVK